MIEKPPLYTDAQWGGLTPTQQATAASWWASLDAKTQQSYLANVRPATAAEQAAVAGAAHGNPRTAATIPAPLSTPSFTSSGGGAFASQSMPGSGVQNGGTSAWDWLKGKFADTSMSDWLKTGGTILGAGLSAYEAAKQRAADKAQFQQTAAERAAEFARSQGDQEAQMAVRAESALNRAPLLDKSQALLLARMGAAPQSFHPRDYTRGTTAFYTPATGGYAPTVDATAAAARGYVPGQGGVDTTALAALKKKFMTSSGLTG